MRTYYPSDAPDVPSQIITRDGQRIGTVHKANGSWFACPDNAEINLIPCDSLRDAAEQVERLGFAYTS